MKGLKIPSYKTGKVSLFDFSKGMSGEVDGKLARTSIADVSFNYSLSTGALKDGVGVKEFEFFVGGEKVRLEFLPEIKPIKCYFYKRFDENTLKSDDRLLVYASDKNFYECKLTENSGKFYLIEGLNFERVPQAVCYKLNGDDVIILSINSSFKIYDGNIVTVVEGVPDITSMCIHNERLFVTTGGEQTELWFSDDFNPSDWYVSLDQAGFIDFQDGRGRLLKVLSFNNYLYVFRNYGISRISAYGDQTGFSATNLFLSSGRIYPGAIVDCGNRVIYLSEDGFYSFDGYSSQRLLSDYDKFLFGVDNSDAVGKFYNGSLYISLKMKINGRIEKVMLVYTPSKGSAYVTKGMKVTDIEVLYANDFSKLVLLVEGSGKIGEISEKSTVFNRVLRKTWKSHYSDFGIDKRKSLAKITLYTKHDIELTVESENSKKTVKIAGSKNKQTVRLGVVGCSFSFSVNSQNIGDEVSKIALYFNYF